MDTNPSGSGPLDVNGATNAFLNLMGPEEGEQPNPEAQQQETEVVETEQEVPETPRYRVKAAGEEREVSLDDLIKSYQLGTDYTQKTQALAEQRKAIEAEKAAVEQAKQLRDQYAQRLELIEKVLKEQNNSMDLQAIEQLEHTDPMQYAVEMAKYTQRERQLAALETERTRIAEKQNAERQQQMQQYLAEQQARLQQAIPEYADPQKGEEVRRDIRSYAQNIGFTEQELNQVYDSRAVQVLWEAAQYRKLMANKPEVTKKVAEAPKTMKPGVGKVAQPETDAIKADRNRLRKSGRARDAAALFERFS